METSTTFKSPLISVADLLKLMQVEEKLVLIDARTGAAAKESYTTGHLANAQFVELEKDLSQRTSDAANGGRHPLPTVKDFAALLGRLGIGTSTHVVVYDDKNGANAAARFWWMMKAIGHEKIQVLDGGLNAVVEIGLPLTNEIAVVESIADYPADEWKLNLANADTVASAVTDPLYKVIDVREGVRYRGESEPIDTIAGHIPGAINIPFAGNLDGKGRFLPAEQLYTKYSEAIGDTDPQHVIVHCGSGVTACHTLLAMNHAGINIPSLYVGSWSEWSRNDRPVATGE
jgi:thiosulfate/3-mercaptopyruvate sulfurtransferase